MKKLFKKAFTLVELLVVIAIIAILGTVSVVGYLGFVKDAHYSDDTTLVSQWNNVLLANKGLSEGYSRDKLNNVIDVQDYFVKNGSTTSDFIPQTDGYHFYWNEDNYQIYLVDDSDGFTINYPETNNSNVTSATSYRLDKSYCALETTIAGVTLNRDALALSEPTDITFSGANLNSVNVKIGNADDYRKVDSNKITLTASSKEQITLEQDPTIYISNVAFTNSSVNVTYNDTLQLNPVYTESNYTAAKNTIEWTSSDTNVATVDSTGKITTLKVGTATITAKATNIIGDYSGSCRLTVNPIKVTAPAADTTVFTYNKSEQTYSLQSNDLYTITGNKQTNAGEHTVNVELKDKINYVWSDTNNSADKTYAFTIGKAQAVITLNSETIATKTYDGSPITIPTASTNFGAVTNDSETVG